MDYNFKCISPSECIGFVKEDSKECVENCKNEIIYVSTSKPYQECVSFTNKYTFKKDDQMYCSDECPAGTITYSDDNRCLSSFAECPKIISADEKSCVSSCEQNEFVQTKEAF